jgi:hypothetical protein
MRLPDQDKLKEKILAGRKLIFKALGGDFDGI